MGGHPTNFKTDEKNGAKTLRVNQTLHFIIRTHPGVQFQHSAACRTVTYVPS